MLVDSRRSKLCTTSVTYTPLPDCMARGVTLLLARNSNLTLSPLSLSLSLSLSPSLPLDRRFLTRCVDISRASGGATIGTDGDSDPRRDGPGHPSTRPGSAPPCVCVCVCVWGVGSDSKDVRMMEMRHHLQLVELV